LWSYVVVVLGNVAENPLRIELERDVLLNSPIPHLFHHKRLRCSFLTTAEVQFDGLTVSAKRSKEQTNNKK
jgi:hypothetical protein